MVPSDTQQMIRLAIEAGLFPEDASAFLETAAKSWFEGGPGEWIVDDLDNVIVGVAFYEPRPATDRVWALTMIAVAPNRQGHGHGAALIQWVESRLREDGQRLLVVETSGTAQYDGTRRFYAKQRYTEVARVPNYFTDGDDMVLFSKDLRLP